TSPPGTEVPDSLPAKRQLTVPRTFINNAPTVAPVERVIAKVHDYSQDILNTRGVGRRRTVQQAIGATERADTEWVDFEQSNRVSARWVFSREVARRYRPALGVMSTDAQKFDAKVGVGSNAF